MNMGVDRRDPRSVRMTRSTTTTASWNPVPIRVEKRSGPEHVSMDLLPSVPGPAHVVHVVLLAVSGLVLPERPHLDHGH